MPAVMYESASPPFGQADLTNCERELIHLAGSIQPHGVLLVLEPATLTVLQASDNTSTLLGVSREQLCDKPVSVLGGNLDMQLRSVLASSNLDEPQSLRCRVNAGAKPLELEGGVHRHPQGEELIVELEPRPGQDPANIWLLPGKSLLQQQLANAVNRFSGALSIAALSEAVVNVVRDMTGYDRVMVYKFDADDHGEIIAEACENTLDSLLGHHYPATDIPQRARELYIRKRVRVLVDVSYTPVPIMPRAVQATGADLDMSLCSLRSMSPLHLEYLKNMGVTGTLVVSLVREGRLWGLIACHHYSPRTVCHSILSGLEMLAEVISTRIAAIENYVQAQVEVLVRRLELRLIEATSTDGDWRQALFRNPRTLLQPLNATGAALFYDDEISTAGEVPSTPDLRALMQWIASESREPVFSCSSVVRRNPKLSSLALLASGVLAVSLSPSRPDYLMWFRKEQPCEYTWAGDPAKPVVNDDPLTLSPRRSFAAWSEIVRGTAAAWTRAEAVLAKAFGSSLSDIILQIHAVRLLIVQHQLNMIRSQIVDSKDPVVIADPKGRVLFASESFVELAQPSIPLEQLDDLSTVFTQPERVRLILGTLRVERASWRGELSLIRDDQEPMPVSMRADVVSAQGSSILGFIVILSDLSINKKLESARRHFESSMLQTERAEMLKGSRQLREPDETLRAIIANANVAAMEIADAVGERSAAGLLEELEGSTRRAAALYRQLRDHDHGA